jgi:hypothetical protein
MTAMPYRSAGDGPYWYHMGGPKGASHDYFLCHTGQPEMVHTGTTQVG